HIVIRSRQILAGHVGDHGDDGGSCAADADEAADGSAHFRGRYLAYRQKSDPGEGAAHRNHTSEGCHGVEPGMSLIWVWSHYEQLGIAKRLNRRGSEFAKSAT